MLARWRRAPARAPHRAARRAAASEPLPASCDRGRTHAVQQQAWRAPPPGPPRRPASSEAGSARRAARAPTGTPSARTGTATAPPPAPYPSGQPSGGRPAKVRLPASRVQEKLMSDASNLAKRVRDRLGDTTEDRLGKALSDLLENPLITGAIGRAFDAREKASQAQEVAMGALNIPSAADIERLTRRLRSVSHRLEGIEDGVHRLDRALSPNAVESRLSAIEQQLGKLTDKLKPEGRRPSRAAAAAKPTRSKVKPTKAKRA